MTAARAGTPIEGGHFVVPAALGAEIILPYSDFPLRDLATGDGIRADAAHRGQASNKITWRAASPLRNRSNASFTPSSAIRAEIISSSRSRPSR